MKNLVLAAAAALAFTAGAASADGLGFGGYGEYAFEAEAFELGLNASYEINSLTLMTEAVFTKPNAVEFGFEEVTVGATFAVHGNVDLYGKVAFDEDFDYNETTVGVAFKF